MTALPGMERIYQSWILDSTRWQHVSLREGDVVVTTPYKSGTTWMLQLVGQVIFDDLTLRPHGAFGRWIDAAFAPVEQEVAALEAMPGRRVFKTHLPADGLPYDPGVRYIYVARDLRDVFVSLWHHHTHYTPELWAVMTALAERLGVPMAPTPPDDIHVFWREWATRGYFAGEQDGYPYWSATRHLQSWWAFRQLPNVMFVHFNDLLADLPAEVGRVAEFIGLPKTPERCAEIADLVCFASMKREAETVTPGSHFGFRGGPATFINKGTNGRWRGVLTPDDLELYDAMQARLPEEAARWLELGARARQPEWSI